MHESIPNEAKPNPHVERMNALSVVHTMFSGCDQIPKLQDLARSFGAIAASIAVQKNIPASPPQFFTHVELDAALNLLADQPCLFEKVEMIRSYSRILFGKNGVPAAVKRPEQNGILA